MNTTVHISVGRDSGGNPEPLLCIRSGRGGTVLMARVFRKKLNVWAPVGSLIGAAAFNQNHELNPDIKNGRKVLSALMGWSKP